MFSNAKTAIDAATTITIIQAENPDGDSLGSALALEEILEDQDKTVLLYCPVEIPKYLRYFSGWDRVTSDFNYQTDLIIIVDTSADILLSKVLDTPGMRNFFESHPIVVIDHHTTASTLSFEHIPVFMSAAATSEIIYDFATDAGWGINSQAAEHLLGSLLADTLGLTTQSVSPKSYEIAAKLTALGAQSWKIEETRREFMKKSPEILAYKAELIRRVEYFLDDRLAVVHVPFEEIEQYSDKYNPGALIGDELRLVENVQLSCVIKTYPDGKLTARLRANSPIAEQVAGYFGGGGHPYAAGFRVYESYDEIIKELQSATERALNETA